MSTKTIRSKADLAINGAPPAFDQPLHVGRPNIGDREAFLQREWLSPSGRLFGVVPNAQAASTQIAVHMALIETNNSATEGERIHGRRCTYSADTLEHDVRSAGLQVLSRGGTLFKPLTNFQFDLRIQNKLLDHAYLDGC